MELGKEIDQHFHDEPQWEEKIFPHWFPILYQCLPYEKLCLVDVDFLNRFEGHLESMRQEVWNYSGDGGYLIYRIHMYMNEYILRHNVGIHPLFYNIFEYIIDSHHFSPREKFQERIEQILERCTVN